MADTLTCDDVNDRELASRYVAGTLDAVATEVFESHFLTCARCQDAIAFSAAVRGAAVATPVARAARMPRRRLTFLAAAGVVFTAVITPVVAHRVRERHAIEALGVLDAPPVYGGVAVRGDASAGDSLFGAGTAAYGNGEYARAASDLRGAIAAGAAVPPARFFLGASLLMLHRPDEAAAELARVIASGDSPYLVEAHYYRALALLQLDQENAAAGELRLVHNGPLADRARSLLARLGERDR